MPFYKVYVVRTETFENPVFVEADSLDSAKELVKDSLDDFCYHLSQTDYFGDIEIGFDMTEIKECDKEFVDEEGLITEEEE